MIVTIDGSAGSGKSTAARKLAARLEIAYLDTGAMYRAIAHAALDRGIDCSDDDRLADFAGTIQLDLDCGPTHTRIRVDGHDVSEAIRSMAVSSATPLVARSRRIRAKLVDQQRRIGLGLGSFVADGRDQGSVVFPNADVKFVLDATLERRGQRRHQELMADGEDVTIEAVIDNLRLRDQVDSKQWQPLLSAGIAVVIDTTNLAIHEVVGVIADRIARLAKRPPEAPSAQDVR